MEPRQYRSESQRRRDAAKDAGNCILCLRRAVTPGVRPGPAKLPYSTCKKCRVKKRGEMKERRAT
jgi:hypothetical protein